MGLLCCCSESKPIDKKNYFGPNSSRKCRDVLCLIIFFIFIAGMIVVAGVAFANGEIKHYYYGTDMYGNMCDSANTNRGTHLNMEGKKVVFYPKITDLKVSFCRETCPVVDDAGKKQKFYDDVEYTLYPTIPVMNRCLPDAKAIANLAVDALPIDVADLSSEGYHDKFLSLLTNDNWFTRVVADVAELWWLIFVCIFAAFFVGLVWLIVVRFLVGAVTWIMVIACFFGFLALTIYVWVSCDTLNAESGNLVYEFVDQKQLRTALRALSIILLVFTILYFFLVIFLRRRIKLAIKVIKEASISLAKTPCLSVFPIFQFLFYLIFLVYWIVVVLFLASSYSKSETIDNISAFGYQPSVKVMYLGLYHLFGGLWIIFWLSGIGQTTVAGAIADRYWASADSRDALSSFSSLFRTLRYSSGSVALGSFLIATVKFIRIIFEYFSRVKAKAAKKNIRWLSCLLKIVSCCIWCFEKIIKWVCESAYIMIAIAGKNFCKSAMHAVSLQASNFIRMLVLKGIAFLTLNITRLGISLICSLIATIVAYNYSKLENILSQVYQTSALHFWYVPVLIVFFGSFLVAGIFTNVYHIAIDTVMLSFCEDETQDGVAVNQKFASLMKKGKADNGDKDDGTEMKKKKRRSSDSKSSKRSSSKKSESKPSSKKSKRDEIMEN